MSEYTTIVPFFVMAFLPNSREERTKVEMRKKKRSVGMKEKKKSKREGSGSRKRTLGG